MTNKLMDEFYITYNQSDANPDGITVLTATPFVSNTSAKLEVSADGMLDFDDVERLRNWLNDWLGHHKETT